MRNSSLDLPLTTTTKVGAGDKERAYVVRQNTCLKALLAVICTLGTLSTVLVYMRYPAWITCVIYFVDNNLAFKRIIKFIST